MKKEDYTKMSLEELKKKEKSTQLATSVLAGMILVQALVGIFLTISNGFSVFTVMPVVFIPILIMSFNNLKKIKEEIVSRDS